MYLAQHKKLGNFKSFRVMGENKILRTYIVHDNITQYLLKYRYI